MLIRKSIILVVLFGYHSMAQASDPVVIISPTDGSFVQSPFAVKVTFGLVTTCHDETTVEMCSDEPANRVELWASDENNEIIGLWLCEPCPGNEAVFEVALPPGPTQLTGRAEYFLDQEISQVVSIVVEEEINPQDTVTSSGTAQDASTSSGTDDATGATSTESSTSDGASPTKDGCGCATTHGWTDGLVWIAAACVPRRRRRVSSEAELQAGGREGGSPPTQGLTVFVQGAADDGEHEGTHACQRAEPDKGDTRHGVALEPARAGWAG